MRLVSAYAAALGKLQKLWVMINKPQLYWQILRHQNGNRGGCYMLCFRERELKPVIFEFVVQIYKCQRSWIISESDQNNLSLLTKLKKCKTNLEISLMVWFVYTLWSFPCSHFAWFSFRLKLVLIHLHFHLHLWYSFTKEDWLKSIWVFSHWT